MKAASVIGEVFSLKQLAFMLHLDTEEVMHKVGELEEAKLIETIYEEAGDVTYRFVSSFFRETLYQRLLHKEQRDLHHLAGQYLVENSLEHSECQSLTAHLLAAEDAANITQLSLKSKRLITIKRTMSALQSGAAVIKSGALLKQTAASKEAAKPY